MNGDRRVVSRFLPKRIAWIHLLVEPSSYLLMLALAITMGAKLPIVRELDDVDFWLGRWLGACATDLIVYAGFAAGLALLEHRFRRARRNLCSSRARPAANPA